MSCGLGINIAYIDHCGAPSMPFGRVRARHLKSVGQTGCQLKIESFQTDKYSYVRRTLTKICPT